MKAYRVQKKISVKGVLNLNGLPFQEGEEVEVIILSREKMKTPAQRSTVKGKVLEYKDPTEPVAENEWETLK